MNVINNIFTKCNISFKQLIYFNYKTIFFYMNKLTENY